MSLTANDKVVSLEVPAGEAEMGCYQDDSLVQEDFGGDLVAWDLEIVAHFADPVVRTAHCSDCSEEARLSSVEETDEERFRLLCLSDEDQIYPSSSPCSGQTDLCRVGAHARSGAHWVH